MIFQIAPCYIDLDRETGGVANIVRQICLALDRNNIPTTLVCLNTELGNVVAQPGTIRYSPNLTIHILERKDVSFFKLPSILVNLFAHEKSRFVHIHTCFSAICDPVLRYVVQHNIACVFTPHGKLSPSMFATKKYLKRPYLDIMIKSSMKKVTEIVASSDDEIADIQNFGLNACSSFIYNGFSRSEVCEISDYMKSVTQKSYILYLGYLDPRKQPDLLIKAYSKSKSKNQYNLILAGPDSYGFLDELKELVYTLNLKNKVLFTGRVLGSNKWYLLENAKGLVLPSKGEGWPVVIAEAIGAKIPLIVSKGCNFSVVEKLKFGIQLESFNEDLWADAIDSLCLDANQYETFKKSLLVESESFSWDAITKKWIDKYNQIINESRTK